MFGWELDANVSFDGSRHYGGDFKILPEAGHNIMMEYHYQHMVEKIDCWLVAKGIE